MLFFCQSILELLLLCFSLHLTYLLQELVLSGVDLTAQNHIFCCSLVTKISLLCFGFFINKFMYVYRFRLVILISQLFHWKDLWTFETAAIKLQQL